ncbi:transcriptional regulator [Xanthomonas arboricola]|nr:transcriptional regulator [Xanthomonas arboricola]
MESSPEPEVKELGVFLSEFDQESDRGAALTAAAVLDDRLAAILAAFFADTPSAKELIAGFNAPLGSLASRAAAAHALGLIQDNEFKEITLIRKIRNEFDHSWQGVSFSGGRVADLCNQLPWLGPKEYEATATPRARLNAAMAILLSDLLWRARLVGKERRAASVWPNKSRGG